jgi:hypothetical protein
MTGAAEHPVLRVLRERLDSDSEPGRRSDRHRVALSIEGGGNRGVISGGMALALDEWRLLPAFDAVFGSSSGALTAAWLLSGDLATGMNAWTRPREFADYSRLSHPLRRRPLVDLDWLIMEYYDKTLGLDSDRVLANPVSLHPLATDAASGRELLTAARRGKARRVRGRFVPRRRFVRGDTAGHAARGGHDAPSGAELTQGRRTVPRLGGGQTTA